MLLSNSSTALLENRKQITVFTVKNINKGWLEVITTQIKECVCLCVWFSCDNAFIMVLSLSCFLFHIVPVIFSILHVDVNYYLPIFFFFEGEASARQSPLPAVQSLFRRLLPGVQTLPDGNSQGPSWQTLREPGQGVAGIGQAAVGLLTAGGRWSICIEKNIYKQLNGNNSYSNDACFDWCRRIIPFCLLRVL